MHMEVRGQLAGVSFPLSLCGPWHGAQGDSLSSKTLTHGAILLILKPNLEDWKPP